MATHKRPELPYNSREEIKNLKNVSYQRINDAAKIINIAGYFINRNIMMKRSSFIFIVLKLHFK